MRTHLLASLSAASLAAAPVNARDFTLEPTPQTIVWGHFDATTKPVLRIASGDRVTFHTLLTNSPEGLEAMGVAPDQVEPELRRIYREVTTDKGPGSHILTGPVYIEGADPGDVLEVRIERIEPAIPYAYNMFRPGMGYQADDFPYARQRIISLDKAASVARFAPGVTLPMRPFFRRHGRCPSALDGADQQRPTHADRRQHGQ